MFVLTGSGTEQRDPLRPGPDSSCCQTQASHRAQPGLDMLSPAYHHILRASSWESQPGTNRISVSPQQAHPPGRNKRTN